MTILTRLPNSMMFSDFTIAIEALPTASTCFNLPHLPKYTNVLCEDHVCNSELPNYGEPVNKTGFMQNFPQKNSVLMPMGNFLKRAQAGPAEDMHSLLNRLCCPSSFYSMVK
jgi:hypothetical protein